jgi:hypothetical protein
MSSPRLDDFESVCPQCGDIAICGLGKAFDCVMKHVHILGSARRSGVLIQDCRPGDVAVGIPIHGQQAQHIPLEVP